MICKDIKKLRWSPNKKTKNKRSSLKLRQFICQKKKKKIEVTFEKKSLLVSKKRKGKIKRGLRGHAENFRRTNLPKKMKLPKILTRYRHLKTKRGEGRGAVLSAPLPTPPSTLMSDIIFQYSFFSHCKWRNFQYYIMFLLHHFNVFGYNNTSSIVMFVCFYCYLSSAVIFFSFTFL